MVKDIQRDPVLGFVDDEGIKASVFNHMRKSSNAHLVEGDFHNLQNVNNALFEPRTNQIMKIVAGIFLKEIQGTNAAEVIPFRKNGGDEVSFFVQGVEGKKLQEALETAKSKAHEFIDEAGLSNLRHHKYPTLAGAGLFVASERLSGDVIYAELARELQHRIVEEKQGQSPPTAYAEARDFRTNGHEQRAIDAIDDPKWQAYAEPLNQTVKKASHDFSQASAAGEGTSIKPRTARFSNFKELPIDQQDYSLMRFDLYNLGGLNTYLQQQGADAVRTEVFSIIQEEAIKEFGEGVDLYHVTGSVIEATVPTQDARALASLKIQIRERLYEEVLTKPVTAFAPAEEIVDIDPAIFVADVPYKKEGIKGVDVIMADMPVLDVAYPAAFFERMDSLVQMQKNHGVSFVTEQGQDTLVTYPIAKEETLTVPNAERDVANAFPFANSLKAGLGEEQVAGLFMAPVGVIAQQVFGLDIAEVLQRHETMRHLMAEGFEVSEIIEHSKTMAEFDTWVDTVMPEHSFSELNILGRPNTHTFMPTELMTMSLSAKWGVVPDGLEKAILSGQLMHRTLSEFSRDGIAVSAEESVSFMEKDIRTGFENETDVGVRKIQFAHETTRALNHFVNFNEGSSRADEETRSALAAVICQSGEDLVTSLESIDEAEIATSFANIQKNPHLSTHANVANPMSVLKSKLEVAMKALQESDSIDPDQKVSILKNFEGLQVIADSFSAPSLSRDLAARQEMPKANFL